MACGLSKEWEILCFIMLKDHKYVIWQKFTRFKKKKRLTWYRHTVHGVPASVDSGTPHCSRGSYNDCTGISLSGNKRPMGHIAHLRKQFKSLKEYDNIITLILRIKKKIYENLLVLHLNKLESPSPKDALCQVWLKLAQWFWRRIF